MADKESLTVKGILQLRELVIYLKTNKIMENIKLQLSKNFGRCKDRGKYAILYSHQYCWECCQ